jgi:predicted metal-dependent hydrolase
MNSNSISPIRTSKTPKITQDSFQARILKSNNSISNKLKKVQSIKEELKVNKEFIKRQKENYLKSAKEKIQKVHKSDQTKKFKNPGFFNESIVKNNLKSHLNWLLQVERKVLNI